MFKVLSNLLRLISDWGKEGVVGYLCPINHTAGHDHQNDKTLRWPLEASFTVYTVVGNKVITVSTVVGNEVITISTVVRINAYTSLDWCHRTFSGSGQVEYSGSYCSYH